MTKNVKIRLDRLEAEIPEAKYKDHDYKHVIRWEANDQIVSRYYKDGIEITRGQYERESKPVPGEPIKVNWIEVDNDQEAPRSPQSDF